MRTWITALLVVFAMSAAHAQAAREEGILVNVLGASKTQIVRVMEKGARVLRATSEAGLDVDPSWSPDGGRIVFSAVDVKAMNSVLRTMDAEGRDVQELIVLPGKLALGPAWSPDGDRLAFWAVEDGGPQKPDLSRLWIVNEDGKELRTLGPNDAACPSWSPDGKKLAFIYGQQQAPRNCIGVIDAAGGPITTIVRSDETLLMPTWSPDGEWIAYSQANPQIPTLSALWRVRANGKDAEALEEATAGDFSPCFSDDGKFIIFNRLILPSEGKEAETEIRALRLADREQKVLASSKGTMQLMRAGLILIMVQADPREKIEQSTAPKP